MLYPYLSEWSNLVIRWLHFTVGVAWIGASFYFNWLENRLVREGSQRPGVAGHLWAIHGGGIYYLEKYTSAPPQLPPTLHWFKWEAYVTWLSGIALLVLVYYLNAEAYLLDRSVSAIPPTQAVGLGVAALCAGWLVYHLLCDSALGRRPTALALVLFALCAAAAFGLSQVFSGRGAYIHVGAILGTIMVGNVFFVIIPSQKQLLAAVRAGEAPDPELGARALLRSRHNNYFTLPVLFVMISNHFPGTYGHRYNWLLLIALSVISLLVRHYFNVRHRPQAAGWLLPAAALGMLALAFVNSPRVSLVPPTAHVNSQAVADATVVDIVRQRCASCHAAQPTDQIFTVAPGGVLLDSTDAVLAQAERIYSQAVVNKVMPLANSTGMLDEERALIGVWYRHRHGDE